MQGFPSLLRTFLTLCTFLSSQYFPDLLLQKEQSLPPFGLTSFPPPLTPTYVFFLLEAFFGLPFNYGPLLVCDLETAHHDISNAFGAPACMIRYSSY